MSVWTHVNATIRIDGLSYDNLPKINEYTIPEGSEGPLTVDYKITGTGMVLAILNIFGDLRDYNGTEEILAWLNNLLKECIIRSGLLEIDVENDKCYLYSYDSNESIFELFHLDTP